MSKNVCVHSCKVFILYFIWGKKNKKLENSPKNKQQKINCNRCACVLRCLYRLKDCLLFSVAPIFFFFFFLRCVKHSYFYLIMNGNMAAVFFLITIFCGEWFDSWVNKDFTWNCLNLNILLFWNILSFWGQFGPF